MIMMKNLKLNNKKNLLKEQQMMTSEISHQINKITKIKKNLKRII